MWAAAVLKSLCWKFCLLGAEGMFLLSSPLLSAFCHRDLIILSESPICPLGHFVMRSLSPKQEPLSNSHSQCLLFPAWKSSLNTQISFGLPETLYDSFASRTHGFPSHRREIKASVKKYLFKWLCLWINDISKEKEKEKKYLIFCLRASCFWLLHCIFLLWVFKACGF